MSEVDDAAEEAEFAELRRTGQIGEIPPGPWVPDGEDLRESPELRRLAAGG